MLWTDQLVGVCKDAVFYFKELQVTDKVKNIWIEKYHKRNSDSTIGF